VVVEPFETDVKMPPAFAAGASVVLFAVFEYRATEKVR
jgi:hypothetical protein